MAKLKPPLVVGFFEDPQELLKAAHKVREKGFKHLDAYAPYPVHGLQKALGIRASWVPYVTLICGLGGATLIHLFMLWVSVVDWPVIVGGKPFYSWPAFVPITFEGGILAGGVMTFVALLVACGMPRFKPFVLDPDITNNKFAIVIPEKDNSGIKDPATFLREIGAYEVRRITD